MARSDVLPRFGKHWHLRWLVTPSYSVLHRVAWIDWEDADRLRGIGMAACGRMDLLLVPGLFSRMLLDRCSRCCAVANVPRGVGAPYNEGIDA
ncbi:MAG: hypothetical protein RLZZ524_402 [Pseudomonadota bacterium]|jgi:hypothetical protein